MSEGSKVVIGVVLGIAVLFVFLWYTDPGKKLSAQVGLQNCVEIQLTGHVACGDDADRLEGIRDDARDSLDCLDHARTLAEINRC